MVIWGALWGAVLGVLWPGPGDFQLLVGAAFGAFAGWTLRRVVLAEIARERASHALAQAVQRSVAQAEARTPVVGPPAAPVRPVAADTGPAVVGATLAQAQSTARVAAPADTPAAVAVASPADAQSVVAIATPAGTQAAGAVASRAPSASVPPMPPAAAPAGPASPVTPSPFDRLLAAAKAWLLGGNTVVRAGVLVLFVGLAFLAKYAVDHQLLPPELRLAGIAAAGIALFAAGVRLRRREGREGYALTLQGAGIAVLYLAVFAAFRLYQFLPPGAAFVGLALICACSAVIAVTQNAMALAFIGFAGGYAAPILVSSNTGDHVGLFGYYLLLGVAIAGLAWKKAWRPLNLLGFFATFGVATVWGVLRYEPRHLASTEPFLVAFFLVFLAATLFYALRHGLAARRAVDATLVFGLPLVAFSLQAALVRDVPYAAAFSSLALGAIYVALSAWLLKQRATAQVQRWLAECFLALALGFLTLAVPLALDGRWTAAVWAVEGAGVFWMGVRQDRWLARAAGMVLQVLAAWAFLETRRDATGWPFVQPAFLGAAMLGSAALALAWWSRPQAAPGGRSGPADFPAFERTLAPFWFWVGFAWWQVGFHGESHRMVQDAAGHLQFLFDPAQRRLLQLLAWVGTAFALHHLALPRRAQPWSLAATPAWTTLPVMLLAALSGLAHGGHALQGWGWFAWPLALLLHGLMLHRLDDGAPQAWWRWVHAGGVWLLVLLGGQVLVHAIDRARLWQTAWASVALLVSASGVLLLLARRAWWTADAATLRWPLQRHAGAYLWLAAAPLAVALALGALLVAVLSDGNARPLPYVPLLNPTDLAVALALATCTAWLLRLRASALAVPAAARSHAPAAVLAALAFVAINTVWLRVAHHWGGVAWNAHDLFASFLVQAGYSILWTVIALVLMVAAHRRALRLPWTLGAGLLALTVLKLFVIDLSNRGGSERVVVFIAVGLLMLVVGWLAPLPPATRDKAAAGLQGASP